jgi:hypothetical protein
MTIYGASLQIGSRPTPALINYRAAAILHAGIHFHLKDTELQTF